GKLGPLVPAPQASAPRGFSRALILFAGIADGPPRGGGPPARTLPGPVRAMLPRGEEPGGSRRRAGLAGGDRIVRFAKSNATLLSEDQQGDAWQRMQGNEPDEDEDDGPEEEVPPPASATGGLRAFNPDDREPEEDEDGPGEEPGEGSERVPLPTVEVTQEPEGQETHFTVER